MSNMCRVKNRGAGYVTYRIPEDGIRRSFAPHETKTVSFEELEKLTYQQGGMAILMNYLQILDLDTINNFGMRVEPEYHMSEQDVARLITSGSLDSFLDALDFAPQGVIDLIKKLSIDIPMVDIQKRKALKAKTGFDVEAALKHNDEDKEETQSTILKQSGERRVKPDAVPAGRRTELPKYNITTPKTAAKETSDTAE
jgi:hypothetical protein